MTSESSKTSIYAAMAANIAIGIAKFVGATISGSSAMLSEGIHSVVDSTNEILLLYGLKQSERLADEEHPLGHGQEIYFWSLVVAVLIFALGGGVSVYEGLNSFQNSEASSSPLVSYIVLGIASIFEGTALWISIKEFNQNYPQNDDVGLWRAIRESKDPSAFIVIVEDFAALVGLSLAFLGIFLSEVTHNPIYDGIASIIIGILLTVVAIILVAETKGLLVGESASLEVRKSIKIIVQSDDAVSATDSPVTFHLGPRDIMLALNIEFKDELSADEIEMATRRIESQIRESHPDIKRIFIEAASVSNVVVESQSK